MDENLKAFECYADFGNPSGHSIAIFICIFPIFHFYLRQSHITSIIKYIGYSLFFLSAILISISRLYLGMHSINQVIMGLISGSYLVYLYFNYF